MEKRISFVVRFVGGISECHDDWQGQVEHVQTGKKRPFKGAQQFLEQIEALSAGLAEMSNEAIEEK